MDKAIINYEHSLEFPKEYVALDIEATSNANYNFLIEISAYKVKNGDIIDSLNTIVKPPIHRRLKYKRSKVSSHILHNGEKIYYVDAFIEKLTGIDNNMIYNGLEEKKAIKKLEKFIGNLTIIGHGVNNDLAILDQAYLRVLKYPLKNNFIDTFTLALFLDNIEYSLSRLCDKYSIVNENVHRAYSDSLCTYKCYEELIKEINYKFHNHKESLFAEWMQDRKLKSIKILKNKTMKNINSKNWSNLLDSFLDKSFKEDNFLNKNIYFDIELEQKKFKDIKNILKKYNCTINRKLNISTNFLICDLDSKSFLDDSIQQVIKMNKSGKNIKILDIRLLKNILFNIFNLDTDNSNESIINNKIQISNLNNDNYTFTEDKTNNSASNNQLDKFNQDDFFTKKRIYFYNKLQDVCTKEYIEKLKDLDAIICNEFDRHIDYIIVGESKEKNIFIESEICDHLIFYLSLGYNIKLINEQNFLKHFI
ncbi:3'-5' exonuclease [Peptostreptococcus equinus]|uniref:3'-5' exonuclease n=1 Tax=Peptostreptococcus equinus TaxID=3003601 RepID=A0ABY7JTL0_9FIRM|nr:3'-5' exonuclease [Peptostreptococcus sp. CBA3647]WAW15826.1 3'-5' exonuclease [Peptostreptococcus sp. CBA3647]